MLARRDEVLELFGQGESEAEALQQIFSQIKPQLEKNSPDIIIRLEPKAMKIIDAACQAYTEKFLGLFFPRERLRYIITAQITVTACTIPAGSINYRQEKENLTLMRHILEMR